MRGIGREGEGGHDELESEEGEGSGFCLLILVVGLRCSLNSRRTVVVLDRTAPTRDKSSS